MKTRSRLVAVLAVAALALVSLLATAAPAAAAFGDRTLSKGMQGDDVRVLQRKLTRLGHRTEADGVFGRQTKRSLKAWEAAAERRVNGVCSRKDARRIKRAVRAQRDAGTTEPAPAEAPAEELLDSPTSATPAYGSRAMRPGDRGGDVAQLQRYLTRLGLATTADGNYGATTKTNVQRYEAWRYMRANGRVSVSQAQKIQEDANRGARYRARGHVFPIRGPHDYGGSGSRFGAPRSGHTHQGQDVAAASGTKLVAVHSGRVAYRQYQAGGAGHYLVIHGSDGRDSVYMHMLRASHLAPGRSVRAGEVIGRVGSTGGSTGPHLHFELWTQHWYAGGSAYDPLAKLQRWDRRT